MGVGTQITGCGQQIPSEPVPTSANQLCRNDFEACVIPVLTYIYNRKDTNGGVVSMDQSCRTVGCHAAESIGGGSGGAFSLNYDVNADFLAVNSQVNFSQPDQSNILLKPLGLRNHGGGHIFNTTNDLCYVTLQRWVNNQVFDQTSASCGQCVKVPEVTDANGTHLPSCGY